MAFQEVTSLDCNDAIQLGGTNKKTGKPNPTKIEGFYLGSRQVASPKSKTGFSALHVFQTAKGNVGVWGKTDLDSKLSQVTPGQLTQVTFTGMKPTKNNPMYSFKVAVDADQRIDVTTTAPTESTEDADDHEGYIEDTGIDGEDEETSPPYPTAPARAASAPSQSQQAKVAALLQKRR